MTEDEDPNVPVVVPGAVELSVRADIARVGKLDVGMRSSLKEMALKLARAFDQCQTDDITALAKLNAELRQTINRLQDVGNADTESVAALLRRLSTPVRDTSQPGTSDAGTERCRHCGESR